MLILLWCEYLCYEKIAEVYVGVRAYILYNTYVHIYYICKYIGILRFLHKINANSFLVFISGIKNFFVNRVPTSSMANKFFEVRKVKYIITH